MRAAAWGGDVGVHLHRHRTRTIGRVEAEAIARRLWPESQARIEPLGGGITNRNFKISVDEGTFVLRIGGKDTGLLGIDRADEHEASVVAGAPRPMGPGVGFFLPG